MKKFLLLGLFIAAGLTINAQNISGEATYKTAGKLPFKFEGSQMPPEKKDDRRAHGQGHAKGV